MAGNGKWDDTVSTLGLYHDMEGTPVYNSQLRALVCVADCGSFTKAAEKLFISPTAVMKQLNALEEHLDVKLLERSSRGIRLTEAGRSIYGDARRLFEFSREAIARARRIAGTAKTSFRVGTSMLNPCNAVMSLWQEIRSEFPQYGLRIIPFEDDRSGILSEIELLGEKFDFLVAACSSEAWLSRCHFHQLGEYRLCCAVPREHRLAKKTLLTVKHLYGECIMMGARGDSSSVDNVRAALERYPYIRIKDTSCFYDIEVFNMCEQEKNILLTLECWKEVHPSFVTIPVNWEFTVPYGILYPLNPSEGIIHFLQHVKNRKKSVSPGAQAPPDGGRAPCRSAIASASGVPCGGRRP